MAKRANDVSVVGNEGADQSLGQGSEAVVAAEPVGQESAGLLDVGAGGVTPVDSDLHLIDLDAVPKRVPVIVVGSWGIYTDGEIAGFEPERAASLIKQGKAKPFEG
ncbi:hypothetical protein LIN78_12070 [Leeia sp. TBRC 13508]|uniref:Uncharacterized protein n=1 Tax=Leeia speluncae TaxID=2884804 RepID=A0ABS8D7Y3_9NEIS|nr:hypothetical protein [Leeia speluncae]MCB6184281.1 hypothetical protein [Leeia speluncae]